MIRLTRVESFWGVQFGRVGSFEAACCVEVIGVMVLARLARKDGIGIEMFGRREVARGGETELGGVWWCENGWLGV